MLVHVAIPPLGDLFHSPEEKNAKLFLICSQEDKKMLHSLSPWQSEKKRRNKDFKKLISWHFALFFAYHPKCQLLCEVPKIK